MQQDKNFIIRLKAAVEKRMNESGVTMALLRSANDFAAFELLKRNFFDSLDSIDVAYLQGEKKADNSQPHAATVTAKQS